MEQYITGVTNVKYINYCTESGNIYVGEYEGNPIVLRVKPLIDQDWSTIMLASVGVEILNNDRYHTFLTGLNTHCEVKITYPVKEEDVRRLANVERKRIRETYEDYKQFAVTLPPLPVRWINNILTGKSEQDKIIYQDDMFVLLPDPKWSNDDIKELYCLGIVKCDLRSLRDLTDEHIDLLQHIYTTGIKSITQKYGVLDDQLRVYVHYHPSFWHLHIHFNLVRNIIGKASIGVAHSVLEIIENLKIASDYYQRITLELIV